ncbi:MAG: hypothetical protein AAGI66_03445 [Cyanobacteria bacterium P01_H01_bin.74]
MNPDPRENNSRQRIPAGVPGTLEPAPQAIQPVDSYRTPPGQRTAGEYPPPGPPLAERRGEKRPRSPGDEPPMQKQHSILLIPKIDPPKIGDL